MLLPITEVDGASGWAGLNAAFSETVDEKTESPNEFLALTLNMYDKSLVSPVAVYSADNRLLARTTNVVPDASS
jgi:uncharacterized membrane protein affecting hemolysin expression